MESAKIVRDAHESGRLLIGARSVAKGLKSGKISHVFFASNCPEGRRKAISHQAGPGAADVADFGGDSARLGEICGKPFTVAVVGVKK